MIKYSTIKIGALIVPIILTASCGGDNQGSAQQTSDSAQTQATALSASLEPTVSGTALSASTTTVAATTTNQDDEAYVLDSAIWENKVIPVCWENANSSNAAGRSTVQTAVTNTWQANSGVRFTGWGSCQAGATGIRIKVEDVGPHVVGLGNTIQSMSLNFTYQNWSPTCQNNVAYCNRVIAVHEFGHALGFAHEQNRPDTPPSICTDDPQGTNGTVMIGAWDLDSVMNYCNPEWNGNGNLSATDIRALQQYYGMPLVLASEFGAQTDGWDTTKHLRMLGDVNGDGKDDIVGFGNLGVSVALSTGNSFATPQRWVTAYHYNDGWRLDNHPRYLADVNGDGKKDIVGFANAGVYLALSTGSSFATPTRVSDDFSANVGWSVANHLRVMADINADGKDDIVGFGNGGTYVALSTGNGFAATQKWVNAYGYNQGWQVGNHPRYLSDINGDGRADIVAIADGGVYVSLSTGTSFTAPSFALADFGLNAGWYPNNHPRIMADVNGDGKDDIVGFGNSGTYVALSTGNGFAATQRWVTGYHYNDGWRIENHPRYLADVNGDGKKDVVGLANAGVYVSLSNGSSFATPSLKVRGYSHGTGWTIADTPRTMADVDGDGKDELVGFYLTGVSLFDSL